MARKAIVEDPDFRKPANIKDFRMGDRQFIGEIGDQNDCTMGEALTIICNGYKEFKEGATGNSENEKQLKLENKELNEAIEEHIKESSKALLEYKNLLKINEELRIKYEELATKEPETKEVEKIVNVPMNLKGWEFICDFGEELSNEIRRMRPFLHTKRPFKKFSEFEPVENESQMQYVKRLAKFSTKRFLDWYKSEYID